MNHNTNFANLTLNEIQSVYYYYENYNKNGDVTELFKKLYSNYVLLNQEEKEFIISNNIFGDTAPGIFKSLYVNVMLNNRIYTYELNENDFFAFDLFIKYIYEEYSKLYKYDRTIHSCYLVIIDTDDIYKKIPEINFLCLSYHYIYFDMEYKSIIQKIYKNINIKYYDVHNQPNSCNIKIKLHEYNIDDNCKSMFEFKPIIYSSGGKLGDFIHQISVVNENFYQTGRKGIIYLKDLHGDGLNFASGLQKTFDDTYNLITSQKYVLKYKIYNGEHIDIDLSSWRDTLNLSLGYNWRKIFSDYYSVEWGCHKWISGVFDDKWKNTIVINAVIYRFLPTNAINILKTVIENNKDTPFYFISFDKESYEYFLTKTGINIPLYKLSTMEELIVILSSCKTAYLGLSAIQAMCNALHKDHSIFVNCWSDYCMADIRDYFNHINDIYMVNA